MVEGVHAVNNVQPPQPSLDRAAERSDDGAFKRAKDPRIIKMGRARESGVALRFPPHSKTSRNSPM